MKSLKINFLIVFIAIILSIAFVNSEEDNANKRNLLLRRPGGPAARPGGPLNKQTSTTTVAPSSQDNEEEIGDDEYDQDLEEAEKEQQDSASSTSTTTTTEPPKKIGPIVRPFRSNEDLLNALKRRQQNQRKGGKGLEKPTPKPQESEQEKEDESAPAAGQKSIGNDRGARRNKFSKSLKGPGSSNGDNLDEQPAAASPASLKRPGRLSLKSTNK
ncbi:uncharacterized protein LOC129619381 [Condylostylus longicornis]|uniref:uncharacterized protein LOC129619381 n=1 Tax=Condylostylus longicornis TaxID=2530218 RepID=UPI00244E4D73|nr:uncharacterized protein LOC129619381 [Condylostylus longicornis]